MLQEKIQRFRNKKDLTDIERECLSIMERKLETGLNTRSIYTIDAPIVIGSVDNTHKYRIYCLYKDNTPVYVGITNRDIRKRVWVGNYDFTFDKCEVIEQTNDANRESFWVKEYSKKYNLFNKNNGISRK